MCIHAIDTCALEEMSIVVAAINESKSYEIYIISFLLYHMHIHAHMLSSTYRSQLNLSKHGVRAWSDV